MESSLKRVLDYKLVFDVLADSNGLIKLETLEPWPNDLAAPTKLPRSCGKFWSELANSEGYLDWERFSGGLEKALKGDSFRLSKGGEESTLSKAEQTLRALQSERGKAKALPEVKAGEIEVFMAGCSSEALMQALARTKKEVFKLQQSVNTLSAPVAATPTRRNGPSQAPRPTQERVQPAKVSSEKTNGTTAKATSKLSLDHEKGELLKGMEVLQRTQQWFGDRLQQLRLEEGELTSRQHSQEMKAEELLALLEQDSQEDGGSLRHIQEINTHLTSLVLDMATGTQPGASTAVLQQPQGTPSKNGPRYPPTLPASVPTSSSPTKVSPRGYDHSPSSRILPRTPSSSTQYLPSGPSGYAQVDRTPTRALSMQNVQVVQEKPKYLTPELSRPRQEKPKYLTPELSRPRHKPRRSLSLKGPSSTNTPEHTQPLPPQQYPLRDRAASMGQLQQQHLPIRQQQAQQYPALRGSTPSLPQNPQPQSPTHIQPRPSSTAPPPTQSFSSATTSYPRGAARLAWERKARAEPQTQINKTENEKDKKKKLSKTVKEQSARIQQLETEKAALVREMFEKKAATQIHSNNDSILSIVL